MLKFHCNKCHTFIKEITPDEASRLTGSEICKECEEIARDVLNKLNVEYKKLAQGLAGKHNKAVVRLEELIRQVFDH